VPMPMRPFCSIAEALLINRPRLTNGRAGARTRAAARPTTSAVTRRRSYLRQCRLLRKRMRTDEAPCGVDFVCSTTEAAYFRNSGHCSYEPPWLAVANSPLQGMTVPAAKTM
jgi:hypothetical protein